jgi:hypothetical protein
LASTIARWRAPVSGGLILMARREDSVGRLPLGRARRARGR